MFFFHQQLDISITMVDISNYNSNNYGSYYQWIGLVGKILAGNHRFSH